MLQISKNLRLLILLMIVCIALGVKAQPGERDNYQGSVPKYIFYFIGDGMGLSQSSATEAYLGALENNGQIKKLKMNSLPHHGLVMTFADNRFITGSAAAGTALATGHKTSINTISMDANRQTPLTSIAELANEKGYKVGIISSASIDHATPAAFYAHQATRDMYYEISLDISKSGFNYFAGGGFVEPEGKSENIQETQQNSLDVARLRGYEIVDTRKDFLKLKNGNDKIIAFAPNLAEGKAMPYVIDKKRKDDISLAEFTQKGIELLENPNGFFMMIEGGKIDWACHANDAAATIKEVLAFDQAVSAALDFYKKHPKETLIVVTADHETGGMALGFAGSHYDSKFALLQHQDISYEEFEKLVKQYRVKKNGNHDFADGLRMVKQYFGLGDPEKNLELSNLELKQLEDAFNKSMTYNEEMRNDDQFFLNYAYYDPLTVTACRILAQKAGIGWTTYSHTATPVPIRSIGLGAYLFTGYFDNTDVPKNLMKLIERK